MTFKELQLFPWEKLEQQKFAAREGDGFLGTRFVLYVQDGRVVGGLVVDETASAENMSGDLEYKFAGEGVEAIGGSIPEKIRTAAIAAVSALKAQLGM